MTTEERRRVIINALRQANQPISQQVVKLVVNAWEEDITEVWETAVEAGRMAETVPLWIN